MISTPCLPWCRDSRPAAAGATDGDRDGCGAGDGDSTGYGDRDGSGLCSGSPVLPGSAGRWPALLMPQHCLFRSALGLGHRANLLSHLLNEGHGPLITRTSFNENAESRPTKCHAGASPALPAGNCGAWTPVGAQRHARAAGTWLQGVPITLTPGLSEHKPRRALAAAVPWGSAPGWAFLGCMRHREGWAVRGTQPSSGSRQQALLSQTPQIPIPSQGPAPPLPTCYGWHAGGVQEP